MGTINFIITADTGEHVFNKGTFKYMYSSYTSGTTGSINIYFSAEGDLIRNDTITLTVTKRFMSNVIKHIAEKINLSGHDEIKHSQSTGLFKEITTMTYTAG